jgi:hypothetical protein
MPDNRDAVTLETARRIARSVAHRQGGTDQALAVLERELTRLEKRAELVRTKSNDAVARVASYFPVTIFPDPEKGKHGKSVDTCTARGVRHAVSMISNNLAGVWALADAPADACEACLSLVPEMLRTELHKRRWDRVGGPLTPGERSHFAYQEDDHARGSLHTVTMQAVCGVKFGYQMDSGD